MSNNISEKPSSKKCTVHLIFIQFLMFLSTFVSCALTGYYLVQEGYYPNTKPDKLCLDIWIANIIILVFGSIITVYILLFTMYKIIIGTITGNYRVSNGFSLCKGLIFFGAIGANAYNIFNSEISCNENIQIMHQVNIVNTYVLCGGIILLVLCRCLCK